MISGGCESAKIGDFSWDGCLLSGYRARFFDLCLTVRMLELAWSCDSRFWNEELTAKLFRKKGLTAATYFAFHGIGGLLGLDFVKLTSRAVEIEIGEEQREAG